MIKGKAKNRICLNIGMSGSWMVHWPRTLAWYFLSSNLVGSPTQPEPLPWTGITQRSTRGVLTIPSFQLRPLCCAGARLTRGNQYASNGIP